VNRPVLEFRLDDLEQRLDRVGAKFVYVFDPTGREGRTWNNAGPIEDVATGSAAGPRPPTFSSTGSPPRRRRSCSSRAAS